MITAMLIFWIIVFGGAIFALLWPPFAAFLWMVIEWLLIILASPFMIIRNLIRDNRGEVVVPEEEQRRKLERKQKLKDWWDRFSDNVFGYLFLAAIASFILALIGGNDDGVNVCGWICIAILIVFLFFAIVNLIIRIICHDLYNDK